MPVKEAHEDLEQFLHFDIYKPKLKSFLSHDISTEYPSGNHLINLPQV